MQSDLVGVSLRAKVLPAFSAFYAVTALSTTEKHDVPPMLAWVMRRVFVDQQT